MKKERGRIVSLLAGVLLFSVSCGRVIYADGPYHGKVIDKETKQPIEGAAVLAVWWKETPMIAQAQITFYDAQETLTDQEGNFTIPGITGGSANPLAKIREPLFTIFKPGYKAFKQVRLRPPADEERSVVDLSPLKTREERKKNLYGLLPGACAPDVKQFCVPEEKILTLIRLMNVEEKNLGSKPTYIPKGDTQ
ncbi:MAG: hypothetical protein ACE5JU_23590 [Candidatus Binatia bacterium]